jgi:predicted transposase YdaD
MGVKEILLDRAKNEGLERGRQEERAKAEDEKRQIAREMLADGAPIEQVIKYTRMSKEEIEAL